MFRGYRSNRSETTSSSINTNNLINPRIENLTIGPVPTDATNVVIAGPNDLGITDKLNALIDEYSSEIVRLSPTGSCASSITAKFPREFLQSLYDTLNVNNNGCYQETQTFLQLLVSYLSSSNDSYINIPRNFWLQIGRVFNELNVNESKLNLYAAALRSMSMAISCDAQSLASNNLLVTTLDTISEVGESAIDEEFENTYPEAILNQPDPNAVLNEVITNIPTTVGESSSIPPTNMIDMTASDASDNIQLHDLDDTKNIESQAYNGLKELYSTKTLSVPISQLKIVNGGKVSYVKLSPLKLATGGTVSGDQVTLTYDTVIVPTLKEESVEGIDLSKSLLDQDWAAKIDGDAETLTRTNFNFKVENGYVNLTDLAKLDKSILLSRNDTKLKFKGAMSRREYDLATAYSIGTALSSIWGKLVSMKLPSPEHIATGTNILAAGLGAAGSLFGSSGLVKASQVISSVGSGLGVFVSTLKPPNGIAPEPKASIPKNALNVVPGIIEAGKSIYEGISINSQHQRINMSNVKNAIENGYIMNGTELATRSRVRRVNNIFA